MLEQIFLKILSMSFSAAIVIVIVCAARILLRKFPKYISYLLWSVVLFRLLCPFTLESSVSIFPNMGAVLTEYVSFEENVSKAQGEISQAQIVPEQIMREYTVHGQMMSEPISDGQTALSPTEEEPYTNAQANHGEETIKGATRQEQCIEIGKYIWIAGMGMMLLYFIISTLKIRKKVQTAIPLKENIYIVDRNLSPFVMGVVKPRIYLPEGLNKKEQEYIVLHEKFHIKRLDYLVKIVAFFTLGIHWFNPFVWVAFSLFCKDMEMSCDEAVIKNLGEDIKADYSASLLALSTPQRMFRGIPVEFGEGDTKNRVENIAAFRKTKRGIAVVLLIGVVSLIVCLAFSRKTGDKQELHIETERNDDELEEELTSEKLAVFRVESLDAIELGDEFRIEDYYIRNKLVAGNRYYIDENQVLWGYGENTYGQLGNGESSSYVALESEPYKIAENVVSVDASYNGYFCIYLTADGKLYGMGSNMCGLLGQEYTTDFFVGMSGYKNVTVPVLLMENIQYARAGIEAIVALDKEGCVWWWGEYASTYLTQATDDLTFLYREQEGREDNPAKMLYNHPTKILEDCVYATTGTWTGAAISKEGELYTWGLNIFGECGTEVTGDDYVRKPQKVLDDVRMVWIDRIAFGNIETQLPSKLYHDTSYIFNVFVQMEDGTMMAAGENLGNKEKEIELTGDMLNTSSHTYSDEFVPIALEGYSEKRNREKLSGLKWGMNIEETETFLKQEGLVYVVGLPVDGEIIYVEDTKYILYFDEAKRLSRMRIIEGGDRNSQFAMGMSLEEVKAILECELISEKIGEEETFWTTMPIEGSYLGFIFYNDKLSVIWETEKSVAKKQEMEVSLAELYYVEPIEFIDAIATQEEHEQIIEEMSGLLETDYTAAVSYDDYSFEPDTQLKTVLIVLDENQEKDLVVYGFNASSLGYERGIIIKYQGIYSYFDVCWDYAKAYVEDFDNDGYEEIVLLEGGNRGTGISVQRLIMFEKLNGSDSLVAYEFKGKTQDKQIQELLDFEADTQNHKFLIYKNGMEERNLDWSMYASSYTEGDPMGIVCLNQVSFEIRDKEIFMFIDVELWANKGGPALVIPDKGAFLKFNVKYENGEFVLEYKD